MKKFSKTSLLSEVIKDQKAVELINTNLPNIINHPRFNEGLNYSLGDVISDNLGAMVGIPKTVMKKLVNLILDLEA